MWEHNPTNDYNGIFLEVCIDVDLEINVKKWGRARVS
jgi:hypothetical protein